MRLTPRKLYICGKEWSVVFKPIVHDDDDNAVNGTTDDKKRMIEVCTKNASDEIRATVLHEGLHAIIRSSLNTHPKEEEECVQGVETALYSMFRDRRNRWLWEFLEEE